MEMGVRIGPPLGMPAVWCRRLVPKAGASGWREWLAREQHRAPPTGQPALTWYSPTMPAFAVLATVTNQPGILFGLTKVLADRSANITYVDIIHPGDRQAEIYLEFSVEGTIEPIARDLGAVPGVSRIDLTPSFAK